MGQKRELIRKVTHVPPVNGGVLGVLINKPGNVLMAELRLRLPATKSINLTILAIKGLVPSGI